MRTGRRRAKTSRRSRRRQNIKICCSAATRCTHKRRAGKSRSLSRLSIVCPSVQLSLSLSVCPSVSDCLSVCFFAVHCHCLTTIACSLRRLWSAKSQGSAVGVAAAAAAAAKKAFVVKQTIWLAGSSERTKRSSAAALDPPKYHTHTHTHALTVSVCVFRGGSCPRSARLSHAKQRDKREECGGKREREGKREGGGARRQRLRQVVPDFHLSCCSCC